MRNVTLRFISALRAAGLRISLSESMDALQAVATVGVEREVLCEALAASLVKEEEERPLFDEVFSSFFAGPRARRKGKHPGAAGAGERQSTVRREQASAPRQSPEPHRRGERSADQIRPITDTEVQEHENAEISKRAPHSPLTVSPCHYEPDSATAVQSHLARRRALLEKPFKAFDPRDVEAAKDLVEELSRRLRGRLSRRYQPRKRGRLDFRRTIRASIPRGGVPIDLLLRGRRPGKPDLLALCDLSGSVALVSDLLLSLLMPATSYFRRVRTFAYVDRLCEISFEHGHVVPHGELDLYARSDFGKVLQQFWPEYGESTLTRNTIVLVLGDARNNRRPPRPDLLAHIRDHTQKLIWLNPEPRARWDTGDSVISRYAPACDAILECGNLRELLNGLERIL